MHTPPIDLGPLKKAYVKFNEFRRHLESEQLRAGAIQAFEYCFELSWKTTRRYLQWKGIDAHGPRDIIRAAAQSGLIDQAEAWYLFLESRNLTAHSYNENVATSILDQFDRFSVLAHALIERLDYELRRD